MEHLNDSGAAKRPEHMHYRKNKYAAPLGTIAILLILVGLGTLAFLGVQFTKGLLDNTKEKEQFEQVISPVIMFDPVPFENAEDAEPLFLLQSSLWSTLRGEKRDSYQFDALGRVVVPASDVEVACARLFGPDVTLEHRSFGDYENTYTYDESTKTYYVPVTVQAGYTPDILRIVKNGDVYTLTVGYVPPVNAWTQGYTGDESQLFIKYMIYELTKVDDHFQLTAIRDLTAEQRAELPSTTGMAPQQGGGI